MECQDAHGIAADAKKGRVTQADQPADAKRDVEPHSRQGEDGGIGWPV